MAFWHKGYVAFLANTPDYEGVTFALKTVGKGCLPDGFLDGWVLELNYFATFCALQVVMLGVAVIMLVECAGAKFKPSKKACIHKFIEGSISGGPAYLEVCCLHF